MRSKERKNPNFVSSAKQKIVQTILSLQTPKPIIERDKTKEPFSLFVESQSNNLFLQIVLTEVKPKQTTSDHVLELGLVTEGYLNKLFNNLT